MSNPEEPHKPHPYPTDVIIDGLERQVLSLREMLKGATESLKRAREERDYYRERYLSTMEDCVKLREQIDQLKGKA